MVARTITLAQQIKLLLAFISILIGWFVGVIVITVFISFYYYPSITVNDPMCVLMDDYEIPYEECYWTEEDEINSLSLNHHNSDLL